MRRGWRLNTAAAAAFALLTSLLFLRRAWHGLWILPFVDETGHIVGGRVLRAGGILYRDFVDSHGPLAYLAAEASDSIPGLDQPGAARVVVLLAMLAATVAVFASPCLRGLWERLCALALFVGLATSLWLVQALCMLDYQPLAGMLLTIGAAQFTFCAWCGASPCSAGLFGAGAAFALTPFTAYSYAPAALLLVVSGIVAASGQGAAHRLLPLALGAATAMTAIGGWVLAKCDIRGYVAYHFILNQFYFARYIHFDIANIPRSFLPHIAGDRIAQSMAALACVSGWLFFATSPPEKAVARRGAALTAGLAGLALCNPRGGTGFQDGAFVVVAFAVFSTGLARLPRVAGLAQAPWPSIGIIAFFAAIVATSEVAGRAAVTSPDGYSRAQLAASRPIRLVAGKAAWLTHLRRAVAPDEPILALPVQPSIYIIVGRPPMTGFDNYFPWDADYSRNPALGRGHDICAAIQRSPPPVIYDDDALIWGRYPPGRYMPCVGAMLATHYVHIENSFFYVRKDRAAEFAAP